MTDDARSGPRAVLKGSCGYFIDSAQGARSTIAARQYGTDYPRFLKEVIAKLREGNRDLAKR